MTRGVTEVTVDNFAGGGGASTGIEQALRRPVDIAINHDPEAVAMHRANHPHTKHYCESVFDVDPEEVTHGRPVGLGWFSPDCKHFSKAKGGKPRDKNIRGLAWVVRDWAASGAAPRVIMLENVEEFRTWGPLDDEGFPIRERAGETFNEWRHELESLGYEIEFRELRAADYGAPTIRKRLFMVARRDGRPIRWPKQTHGKGGFSYQPYRAAYECIDFSDIGVSIFGRKKDLAEPTLRRIAVGMERHVIGHEAPFLVSLTHQGGQRVYSVMDPLNTVTGAHRGELALVTPYIAKNFGGHMSPGARLDDPLSTATARDHHALVMPFLARTAYKGANGSYVNDVRDPLFTLTAQSDGASLIAPVIARMNFDGQAKPTDDLRDPLATVTTQHNKHMLLAPTLTKLYGTALAGQRVDAPLATITSGGQHIAATTAELSRAFEGTHAADVAFLMHYFSGGGQHQSLRDPLHAVTTKDRVGLVTVRLAGDPEPWVVTDIFMRMLRPRELFLAQGFPEEYVIDPVYNGKPLTKTAQIRMVGNSVCPPAARAVVEANMDDAPRVWSGAAA
ncbi:MAG: DNA cytosine methyltransferase [Dehalococcoidia bacterium]